MPRGEDTGSHPGRQVGRDLYQKGVVGPLVAHDGEYAHIQGPDGPVRVKHYSTHGQSIVDMYEGHDVAAVPLGWSGDDRTNLHKYDPQAHGNLPGARQPQGD